MKFQQGASYRVCKPGAFLEAYKTMPDGIVAYEQIDLTPGMVIEYAGADFDEVDYDVVPLPYFLFENRLFIFQPSSFSGMVPPGFLEAIS
jgi:hypothetical protein